MGKTGEIVICLLCSKSSHRVQIFICTLMAMSCGGRAIGSLAGWVGKKRAISLEKQHKWREITQPGDAQGVPRQATPGKIPTKTVAQKQDPAHTEHFVSFSDH